MVYAGARTGKGKEGKSGFWILVFHFATHWRLRTHFSQGRHCCREAGVCARPEKKKKWDDDNSNNNEKDEELIEAMDLAER